MESLIDKFFSRTSNLDYVTQNIKKISIDTEVDKLFNAINSYSDESELRYVGGCIRKIINKEKIDDIDLATNLSPVDVSQALKKNNINFICRRAIPDVLLCRSNCNSQKQTSLLPA